MRASLLGYLISDRVGFSNSVFAASEHRQVDTRCHYRQVQSRLLVS